MSSKDSCTIRFKIFSLWRPMKDWTLTRVGTRKYSQRLVQLEVNLGSVKEDVDSVDV